MSFIDFNLKPSLGNLWKWVLLKVLSILYRAIIECWLLAYRFKIRKGRSVNAKVISVGNITTGGTGKTPMVDWILDFCASEDIEPAVLTRGYGANRGASMAILDGDADHQGDCDKFGDEPLMLFNRHPQSTIVVSADRVLAAETASKEKDLLILDDGMQHLKLRRDLNIVLLDASTGIGNGQLIPLGPLREPLRSLSRADVVIYSKTNLADAAELKEMLQPYFSKSVHQFESQYQAVELIASQDNTSTDIEKIKGKKCLLFSGIGNPTAFENTMLQLAGNVVGHYVLPDHFRYEDDTLQAILAFAAENPHDFLICTEKDWIKLQARADQMPLFYFLKMSMTVDPEFNTFLKNWMAQKS